jgi:hypothetical protein
MELLNHLSKSTFHPKDNMMSNQNETENDYKPAIKGSAVFKVSKSKKGRPWLNLPMAENIRRHNTSPPASTPICLININEGQ